MPQEIVSWATPFPTINGAPDKDRTCDLRFRNSDIEAKPGRFALIPENTYQSEAPKKHEESDPSVRGLSERARALRLEAEAEESVLDLGAEGAK